MPDAVQTLAEQIVSSAIELVSNHTLPKEPNDAWESFVRNLEVQLEVSIEIALRAYGEQRYREGQESVKKYFGDYAR